jgi:hypothetical protein
MQRNVLVYKSEQRFSGKETKQFEQLTTSCWIKWQNMININNQIIFLIWKHRIVYAQVVPENSAYTDR